MPKVDTSGPIKKTVILHPIMDTCIRKTWAMLIDEGYEATYSTALNYMLFGSILEGLEEREMSEEAREDLTAFLEDDEVINKLNIQDHLEQLRDHWRPNR